jgi:hypothetical protein
MDRWFMLDSYNFFKGKHHFSSGKGLGRASVHWLASASRECRNSTATVITSRIFSFSGKPLVKTSRMSVVNTEKPTVTVDIGSTVRTVQGVNVTINCQVAGEKFITGFIHFSINNTYSGWGMQKQI